MQSERVFERKVIFSNQQRELSPSNEISVNLTTTSDNCFYDLSKSYLEMELEATFTTAFATGTSYVDVIVKGQNAGLVSNSTVDFTYINASGELSNVSLQSKNENVGHMRSVISSLFTSAEEHRIRAGFTEKNYEKVLSDTASDLLFENTHRFYINSSDNKKATTIYRIPLSDCLEGCNYPSLLNLKNLQANFTFHQGTAFFTNSNAITSVKITKLTLVNPYIIRGSGDSISPELRQLANTTITTKTISMPNTTNITENIIIPFAAAYLIVFFTNSTDYTKVLDVRPKYFKVGISGSGMMVNTHFKADKNYKDSTFWDMLDTCVNDQRLESLVTNNTWNKSMHYIILPLSQLMAQQAAGNVIQLEAEFPSGIGDNIEANKTIMNMIFIKDSNIN